MKDETQVCAGRSEPFPGAIEISVYLRHRPVKLAPPEDRERLPIGVEHVRQQLQLRPLLSLARCRMPSMARDAAAGSFEFDVPRRPAVHIDHEIRSDGKFWESDLSMRSDRAVDLLSCGSWRSAVRTGATRCPPRKGPATAERKWTVHAVHAPIQPDGRRGVSAVDAGAGRRSSRTPGDRATVDPPIFPPGRSSTEDSEEVPRAEDGGGPSPSGPVRSASRRTWSSLPRRPPGSSTGAWTRAHAAGRPRSCARHPRRVFPGP